MQNSNDPSQLYSTVQTETSTDLTLVLMAYDGIVRNLQNVLDGSDEVEAEERIEWINNELINAQQIVDVLIDGLNFDEGEVSLKLESFYQFIRTQLIHASVNQDMEKVKDVLQLVEKVKAFWELPRTESTGSDPAEPESSPSVDSLR
jgi:flagellar biosynthetic protein FliS